MKSPKRKPSTTQAKVNSKMSAGSGTSGYSDVVVDAEDEKYTAPLGSMSAEEKTCSTMPSEATDTKAPARKRSSARRTQPKELKKVTQWHGSSDAALEDEPFYHGYMARAEAEKVITKDGEFLVRKAEVRGRECYLVSIKHKDGRMHLRIQEAQELFWLQTFCFNTVQTLIRYHMALKEPIYGKNVILKSYVTREQWQLYHEQITTSTLLGHGAFGEVYKGTLTVGLFTKPIEVAVKTLKSGTLNSDDRVTFLREANVMLKLQHKNVIRLYGVATQKEPIMIVMELAPGGSLLNKVKKESVPLTSKRNYCYETINGMAYLESQQVMHRDLAARNCLISSNDICKISDFGLSLLGHTHKEKQLLKVPVRWLPPEVLTKGLYSNKSDVWSCGVLMFEVFSNGETPYKEIAKLHEVRKQVVFHRLRLKPPPDMPAEESAIMMSCFEDDPAARPSFDDLRRIYKESCGAGTLQKVIKWLSAEKTDLTPVKG